MKPPWIQWVDDQDATGEVAEMYAAWKEKNPGRDCFPSILKCFSSHPDLLRCILHVSYSLHFTNRFLDQKTKERIATLVSGLNHCVY